MRIYEEFLRNSPIREIKRNIAVWLGEVIKEVDDEVREKFIKVMIFKITKENENNF